VILDAWLGSAPLATTSKYGRLRPHGNADDLVGTPARIFGTKGSYVQVLSRCVDGLGRRPGLVRLEGLNDVLVGPGSTPTLGRGSPGRETGRRGAWGWTTAGLLGARAWIPTPPAALTGG